MSRAFREHLERTYPFLDAMYNDGHEREQADQGMCEWYEDQDAQDEYKSWLRTLEEQHR